MSIGWSPGTEESEERYAYRLQAVRTFGYQAALPEHSFRIAPVPPWNSRIDHPNPWRAIPAFLRDFPDEVRRRKGLTGY